MTPKRSKSRVQSRVLVCGSVVGHLDDVDSGHLPECEEAALSVVAEIAEKEGAEAS